MATRKRSTSFVTKPGSYGPLFKFRIKYDLRGEPDYGERFGHAWAYDFDHAHEKFLEECQFEGFDNIRILAIEKVKK